VSTVAGPLIMGRQPVSVGLFTPPWEKLGHLVMFAAIGGTAGIASGATGTAPIAWRVRVAIGVGAIDELHQRYFPGRWAP
jgi:VanZ family protein